MYNQAETVYDLFSWMPHAKVHAHIINNGLVPIIHPKPRSRDIFLAGTHSSFGTVPSHILPCDDDFQGLP